MKRDKRVIRNNNYYNVIRNSVIKLLINISANKASFESSMVLGSAHTNKNSIDIQIHLSMYVRESNYIGWVFESLVYVTYACFTKLWRLELKIEDIV